MKVLMQVVLACVLLGYCAALPQPVFRMDMYTEEQFEELWEAVPSCSHTEYATPIDNMSSFECVYPASPASLQAFGQRFAAFNLSKPVKLRLENVSWSAPRDPLFPIRHHVVLLDLQEYDPLPVNFFVDLRLPNLLYLSVQMSTNVSVPRGAFQHTPRLRILKIAIANSVVGLESDFVARLPDLVVLSLEADYREFWDADTLTENGQMRFDLRPRTMDVGDRMPYVRALHCGCQYVWLRRLYRERPQLIQPKAYKEVFVYGNDAGSYMEQAGDLFIPFDCAKTGKDAVLDYKKERRYSQHVPQC